EFVDAIHLFRPRDFVGRGTPQETAGSVEMLRFSEEGSRALSVVDVAVQNEPPQNTTVGVANREASNLEPSICAVGSPNAVFELVRLTELDGPLPGGDDAGKVVGMNGVRGRPPFELVERLAEVVQHLPIHELNLAVGRRDGNQRGNTVDDLVKR